MDFLYMRKAKIIFTVDISFNYIRTVLCLNSTPMASLNG